MLSTICLATADAAELMLYEILGQIESKEGQQY